MSQDSGIEDCYDDEIKTCIALAEANPKDPLYFARLGGVLLERRAFSRAGVALRISLNLGATDANIHVQLAQIANTGGAYFSAAQGYQIAARQLGGHTEWSFLAAHMFWRLHWPDAAMAVFRHIPTQLPDWWADVRQRSQTLLRVHRQTVRQHLSTLRTGPIDIGPGRELLEALTGAGRLGLAARLAACLAATYPDDRLLIAHRARLAFRTHSAEAGLSIIEASMAAGIRPDIELAAKLAMEMEDPSKAMRLLNCVPKDHWSHGEWMQACRVRIATEDADGLVSVAGEWEARSGPFESAPYQFVLEGMRLANRLPFLTANAPTGVAPAGHAPESVLLHFWDTKEPPADVAATIATWRILNPDLGQTILSLDSARAFILAEYGDRELRCFELCRHAAMKSDYVRLLWLVIHGGLYADVDEICVSSVAPLLEALIDSELVVVMAAGSPPYLNNCVLGARRGSPLLAAAAAEVTERILAANNEGRNLSIWDDTGPGLLTRTVARALGRSQSSVEARRVATLIPELRKFAHNNSELAYKRTTAGNWRLS